MSTNTNIITDIVGMNVSVNLVVSSSDDFCTMEARGKPEEEAAQSFIAVEGPIVCSDTQWKVSHRSRSRLMPGEDVRNREIRRRRRRSEDEEDQVEMEEQSKIYESHHQRRR